ncbi:hypothetical protein CCH79_00020837, partial [Gambusia affinis]
DACFLLDSHLASYNSMAEYTFIRQLILNKTTRNVPSWVGGFDSVEEGEWFWSDGSKFWFTNWRPGGPNNDGGFEHCIIINYNEEEFMADEECTKVFPFVCAKPL